MTQIDVLLFDYEYGNINKYSEFYYIEGFTHYKSSYISLQLVNPHPEITHVNEPICFGKRFELHSLVTMGLTHWGKSYNNLKMFNV